MKPKLTIGPLAREVGLPARTIRFYEAAGLLPPAARTDSGYRVYTPSDARRLRLIRQARSLGLSIPQVRELVDQAFDLPCGEYQKKLTALIRQCIQDTGNRITELQRFRRDLESLLEHVMHVSAPSAGRVADCEFCPFVDEWVEGG